MHPEVWTFEVFGVERTIGSYGVCLVVALIAGVGGTVFGARRRTLDADLVLATAAVAVGGGLAGGYLLAVAVQFAQSGDLTSAFARGGLVFYGGLAGGALGAYVSARVLRVDARAIFDVAVVPFALAHAVGRIGCLLGGCCHGSATGLPWAVVDASGVARHPAPLYEALGLVGLAVLFTRLPWPSVPGARALQYVAAYAALRLVVEQVRGDALRGVSGAGLSTSMVISGALILGAVIASVPRRAGSRR